MIPGYCLRLRQRAPGDAVAASRLVAALHLRDPATRLAVEGPAAAELFRHDPRVTPDGTGLSPVTLDYGPTIDLAAAGGRALYLDAPLASFIAQTRVPLPPTPPRPDLRLADAERDPGTLPAGLAARGYWLLAAGSKSDMPLKQLAAATLDGLDGLTPGVRWVQVGAVAPSGALRHRQHAWPYCLNLLGRTSLRELMCLVYHARGVVCGVSLPMLLACAFRTPCVVVAGGREAEALHRVPDWPTLAYLTGSRTRPCERATGCWRQFARAAHADPYPPGTLCAGPREDRVWGAVGGCLADVTVTQLAAEVRRLDGSV